ncbi:MAG: hypothetical protein AAB266_02520, partial [Nitrospirota bacterium]
MYLLNNRLGLSCILFALAMAAQLFLALSGTGAMTVERIVAIVNNEIITLSEVNEEVHLARLGIEGSRVQRFEGSKDPLASGSLDPLDPFTRE